MSPHSGALSGIEQFAHQAALRAAQTGEPQRFAKLADRLRVLTNSEISKVQAVSPAPACKAGCSWCCHRLVVATLPEIYAIAGEVLAWEEDRRATFKDKLRRHDQTMAAYWRYESDEYKEPCPFLERDLCTIYEARPISCQSLSSYDPEDCRIRMETGISQVREVPGQAEAGSTIMSAMVGAFDAAGKSSGTFDLAFALLKVLEDPELLDRVAAGGNDLEGAKIRPARMGEDKMPSCPEAAKVRMRPAMQQYVKLRHPDPDAAWRLLADYTSEPFGALGRAFVPPMYESTEQLEEWWDRLGRAIEVVRESKFDSRIAFETLAPLDTFFWAYAGKDVRPYLEGYIGHAHEHFAKPAFPELTRPIEGPRRPGKLRIGYISYRLKRFNGSRWALGWLVNHSSEVETYAFNLNPREDDVSLRWRHKADKYFHMPSPVSAVAPHIRSLDLDLLIFTDIGMDGPTIQLSLLRLARKQATAWGHPVTSGSPVIDYYLSSELMEPPNGDEHYVEKLIRLPGSGLTYPRVEITGSEKSRSELGLPEGGFIFCAQRAAKLLPRHDALFREICERTSKPIVFISQGEEDGGEIFRRRLKAASVNAVVLDRLARYDFIRVMQLADLSLDSPAWNGGNTTVEALALGVPVVSHAGEFMRGRHSLAFMTQAGVQDLIGRTEREYVELACDENRQHRTMKRLNVEPIYGDISPVRAIEALIQG